jgi:hypothetical protein
MLGSGSGSCSVARFVINGFKFSDSNAGDLVEVMHAALSETL